MIANIVQMTHLLLKNHLSPGSNVLDGTVGMGNDTEFLAQLVGKSGTIWGFDIQEEAIISTKHKLANFQGTLHLNQTSHANIDQFIPNMPCLDAAIFNLGYLPKGDKAIITTAQSTISALEQTLIRLKVGGILLIAAYIGHEGGYEEYQAIKHFLATCPQKEYHIAETQHINQKHQPPRLFIIERRA